MLLGSKSQHSVALKSHGVNYDIDYPVNFPLNVTQPVIRYGK